MEKDFTQSGNNNAVVKKGFEYFKIRFTVCAIFLTISFVVIDKLVAQEFINSSTYNFKIFDFTGNDVTNHFLITKNADSETYLLKTIDSSNGIYLLMVKNTFYNQGEIFSTIK